MRQIWGRGLYTTHSLSVWSLEKSAVSMLAKKHLGQIQKATCIQFLSLSFCLGLISIKPLLAMDQDGQRLASSYLFSYSHPTSSIRGLGTVPHLILLFCGLLIFCIIILRANHRSRLLWLFCCILKAHFEISLLIRKSYIVEFQPCPRKSVHSAPRGLEFLAFECEIDYEPDIHLQWTTHYQCCAALTEKLMKAQPSYLPLMSIFSAKVLGKKKNLTSLFIRGSHSTAVLETEG